MISSVAVEAISDAPIMKLRSVCTAITSRDGLRITLVTQSVRAS